MNDLVFSFNVVMPLFLVIGVGYFLKQIGLIDDKFVNTAIKFNFKVGLSTLIFKNIYTANFSKIFNPRLMLFAFTSIVGTVVLLCIIIPIFIKNKKTASAMIHTIYRSNFVLLGLPVSINMFGESNIGPVALLLPVAIPTYNFFAVLILSIFDESGYKSGNGKIKSTVINLVKNPLILGSLAAIILQVFSFKLPMFVEKAVFDISSLGTPLALITLGAQFELKKAIGNIKYSLIATFGRLIMVPFIVVVIAFFMGFRKYELGAIYVLFSSPSAISCYVMAKEMNSDYELTGDVVLLTTFFSMFTIFTGIYLLKMLSLI